MCTATELEEVLRLLDQTIDGIAIVDADGALSLANLPFRRSAEALGLRLTGPLVDCVLELADRTSEPYAFTAAVERLRGEGGGSSSRMQQPAARSSCRSRLPSRERVSGRCVS